MCMPLCLLKVVNRLKFTKKSLWFIFYCYFFATIDQVVCTKMSLQTTVARNCQNSNLDYMSGVEKIQILYKKDFPNSRDSKSLIKEERVEMYYNIKTSVCIDKFYLSCTYGSNLNRLGSLKSDVLIRNPYQVRNLFTETFLKSLFDGFSNSEDNVNVCNSSDKNFTSEYSNTIREISSSEFNTISVREFFKGEQNVENRNWATWNHSKAQFLQQQSPDGLLKLSIAVSRNTTISGISVKKVNEIYVSEKHTEKPWTQILSKQTLLEKAKVEENKKICQKVDSMTTLDDINGSEKIEQSILQCIPELITQNETHILEDKYSASQPNFSKLILSISQDNSKSDLDNLEEDVNWFYHSKQDGLVTKKLDCFPSVKTSKRSRVDSGISLDSRFEDTLSESSPKVLNSEDSVVSVDTSREFLSGLNSTKPSYYDDCMKVCYLCNEVILNRFFMSCRFGLLLNCFHSFCYSCIRNRSEAPRLSTGLVKCPTCDEPSPGIVPSSRWIKDMAEKTALFQNYEKETQNFRNQQQVFFKNYIF